MFTQHHSVCCNLTTAANITIKVLARRKWHAALSSCLEKEGINVLVQSFWLLAGIGLWHKDFHSVSWCGWLLLILHHSPLASPFLTVMSASTNEMGNQHIMHARISKQDVLRDSGRWLLWKKINGRHHARLSAVRGVQVLKMKFCCCGQEIEAPVPCAPVVWTGLIMTAVGPTRHQMTRVLHCPVTCAVSRIPSSLQLNSCCSTLRLVQLVLHSTVLFACALDKLHCLLSSHFLLHFTENSARKVFQKPRLSSHSLLSRLLQWKRWKH